MSFKKRLFMLPGPSEPYPEILEKLQSRVLPHYGPDWEKAFRKVCEDLKRIFQTKGEIVLYPGSGEAATHMAVANMIKPGDKVIILTNGCFGEYIRMAVEAFKGYRPRKGEEDCSQGEGCEGNFRGTCRDFVWGAKSN